MIIDICLQEKAPNPFYAYLAQKFCEFHRRFQVRLYRIHNAPGFFCFVLRGGGGAEISVRKKIGNLTILPKHRDNMEVLCSSCRFLNVKIKVPEFTWYQRMLWTFQGPQCTEKTGKMFFSKALSGQKIGNLKNWPKHRETTRIFFMLVVHSRFSTIGRRGYAAMSGENQGK